LRGGSGITAATLYTSTRALSPSALTAATLSLYRVPTTKFVSLLCVQEPLLTVSMSLSLTYTYIMERCNSAVQGGFLY
jgi:hypothetical protein